MTEEERRAWQVAMRYQLDVCYLHGTLVLIRDAMTDYNGQELKDKISLLVKEGKEHTPLAAALREG